MQQRTTDSTLPVPEAPSRLCRCGCAQLVRTRGARFRPGHWSKVPENIRAAGAKSAATQRGRKRSPQSIAAWRTNYLDNPAKVAEAGRKNRRHHLDRRANDNSAPPWHRWVAQRMLDLDIDRRTLAARLGITLKAVYQLLERANEAPRRGSIRRLETILGPAPMVVRVALNKAYSQRWGASGRRSTALLKRRIKRWTRHQLMSEIGRLLSDSPLPDEASRRLRDVPYSGSIGQAGYSAFMWVKAYAARQKIKKPLGRAIPGKRRGLFPRRDLALVLSGLQQQGRTQPPRVYLFQCQGCGELWHRRIPKAASVPLCAACYPDYRQARMSWIGSGQRGAAPTAPRGRGRLIKPTEIRDRLILLLRYRLGQAEGESLDKDYKAIYDIERRVRASTSPWCQRITCLLNTLA